MTSKFRSLGGRKGAVKVGWRKRPHWRSGRSLREFRSYYRQNRTLRRNSHGATKEGYQRPPQPVRVARLANDLRRGVDTPTAVLLNIRDRAILEHLPHGTTSTSLSGSLLSEFEFEVVDGQHRILGYEKAINDGWHEGQSRLIPFTCLLGADEAEEMRQFYIVNSTAKAVRADLAFALLKRRNETEDDLIEVLQAEGKDWQVEAQRIVEDLASSSPVWRGRIKLPGMTNGGTIMSPASMVNSLKKVIASPFFSRLDEARRTAVIDAFWQGTRIALPESFADPKSYSIQKGIGVSTLHEVLPEVIELVRSAGDSVSDPNAYAEVLSPALNELRGENQSGEAVSGSEFWRAGESGAAGSYSSGAGKRVLAAKLRDQLGQID